MFINISRERERQAVSVWQNEWSCKSVSKAWMVLRSTKTSLMNHRDLDSLLEFLGFRLFQYTQSTLTKLTNLKMKLGQLWIKSLTQALATFAHLCCSVPAARAPPRLFPGCRPSSPSRQLSSSKVIKELLVEKGFWFWSEITRRGLSPKLDAHSHLQRCCGQAIISRIPGPLEICKPCSYHFILWLDSKKSLPIANVSHSNSMQWHLTKLGSLVWQSLGQLGFRREAGWMCSGREQGWD